METNNNHNKTETGGDMHHQKSKQNRTFFKSNGILIQQKTPMLYFDSILSKYDDDDSKTIDRDRERKNVILI